MTAQAEFDALKRRVTFLERSLARVADRVKALEVRGQGAAPQPEGGEPPEPKPDRKNQ